MEAEYEVLIEQAKAEVRDEFTQRQHVREMEMSRMQQEFEVQREFVRTIGVIAASGINPAAAMREIQSLMLGVKREGPANILPERDAGEDRVSFERQSLKQIQSRLGIKEFDVQPHHQYPSQPGLVEVEFGDFTVLMQCTEDYPRSAPLVQLSLGRHDAVSVTVPWREGGNLVDATTAAVMQARTMTDNEATGG